MRWIITKVNDLRIEVTDPTGGTVVSLRLDDDETSACTHLYQHYNGSGQYDPREDDTEYLHICDFSEFLEEMRSLDELRKAVKRGEIGVTDCPHECIAHGGRAPHWCQACGVVLGLDAKEE